MTSTAILLATKDNASSQLAADITASSLSIALVAGQGANLPQPYTGTATSLGTSTALNCTGILATIGSGSAKKFIRNVTDGSVAFLESIATNAATTSPLLGGTTNVWNNGDEWRIDEFVATLEAITTSEEGVETVTKREEILVRARATDTLTVATGGRGYNSTIAQSFEANDYVRLLVCAPYFERLKDYLYELTKLAETTTNNAANNAANIRSGSDFYAVTTGSSNNYAATYANLPDTPTAGLRVTAKANFTNTGASNFNFNSFGNVAIKKVDGTTSLESGDIKSGQIITLEYDGTYWQMISPVGNPVPGFHNFGNGSGGALNVTSGTTTIDCTGLGNIIVKQYTSFNVSAGATLAFSNVPAGGIIFVPLVQGNFTLAGTLDLSGCGSAGGAGVTASRTSNGTTATNGNDAALPFNAPSGYMLGLKGTAQAAASTNLGSNACGASSGGNIFSAGVASSSTTSTQGTTAANAASSPTLTAAMFAILNTSEGFALIPGAGGGSAGVGINMSGYSFGTISGTTADGGRGGGCLYAVVGGNYSFTGTLKLSGVSANNSSVSTSVSATQYTIAAGGSAGGAAGFARALYRGTLTANSGTVESNPGSGGTAASGTNASNQASTTNGATATATGAASSYFITQIY